MQAFRTFVTITSLLGALLAAPRSALAQQPAPAPAEPGTDPAVVEPAPAPVGEGAPAPEALATPVPDHTASEPAEPPTVDALGILDNGFVKLGFLGQFWLLGTKADDDITSTFRMRRAEIKVYGEIIEDLVAYKIMIDPAKTLSFGSEDLPVAGQEPAPDEPGTVAVPVPPRDTSILQDVELTLLTEYVDITAGQFKIPISYEGFNSSSKLPFPERALVAREYGDERDVGIMLSKELGMFYYALGVFNGEERNRVDVNNQKDVAARVEVTPVEPLMLAVAGLASVGARDQPTTKERAEFDVRLELADLIVQGEYIRGWDGSKDDDPRQHGQGFYVLVAYKVTPAIEPQVRVGALDTDLDVDKVETWAYEAGLNYYLKGHNAKLQLAYGLFDYAAEDTPRLHQCILAAQLSF